MTYQISDRPTREPRSKLSPQTAAPSPTAPSVWSTQEWTDMQDAITGALRPYNEAWDAVSKALKEHFRTYAPK